MTQPNSSGPLRVAVVQAHLPGPLDCNLARVERLVRQAADRGAQIVLVPELFAGPYFPVSKQPAEPVVALPRESSPAISLCAQLAGELGVVIPASFYEESQGKRFNSVAIIDADGSMLGVYRKSHIPDGPGYEEKEFFAPGDTGFKVWQTRFGKIGVGICWDQWFPEAARAMALAGAQLLLYPSTIGSEPDHPDIDTSAAWQTAMRGHAAANAIPLAAANRVGVEEPLEFFGRSFVCGARGEVLVEMGNEEGVAMADLDLAETDTYRSWLGVFRDRRPDLYSALTEESES